MKRRKVFTFLVIIISYLCLSSCLRIDPNISSTIRSNIYKGSLSSSGNFTTYFLKGKGDVPYIDFVDLTESVISRDITNDSHTENDYKVSRTDNDSYMIVNAEKDTVYFSNYEAFVSKNKNEKSFDPKSSTYKYSKIDTKEQVYTKEVTFDLSKYNIDIVESKGSIYIPYQIYDTLIYSQIDVSLAFNGHDYYYVSNSSYFNYRNYYTSYFSGRNQTAKRSTEMANFTYNHLIFTLDNFFGIKDTRKITSFNDLCVNEGLKNDLIDTNCETFNKALNNLIYSYLDDGHSTFVISSNYLKYDANADAKYADSYKGTRRNALKESYNNLSYLRKTVSKQIDFSDITGRFANEFDPSNIFAYSGNTLVITLDSFSFPTSDYYQKLPNRASYSNDSFSKLFYAINTYIPALEEYKGLKISNIVIDVTLNGGGYVDDCIGLLGFLSNDYYLEYENYASKDISKVNIKVDTNLDNIFNEKDSFKDKYNFYILTSNYSFSCANMLATVCKEQNLATILGEETGGGGAIVYNLCLADSTSINISGCHSLVYRDSDNQTINSENKVIPDYTILRTNFYDVKYLNTYINTIN